MACCSSVRDKALPGGRPAGDHRFRPQTVAARLTGATVRALDAIARRRAPKPTDGAVRIEPLGIGDGGSAVELVTRALRVDAGDRGEQFGCDIAAESRQMFVAKAGDQVIAFGRVVKLAADEAARGALAGYYPAACWWIRCGGAGVSALR
jgi:hypothetical protein